MASTKTSIPLAYVIWIGFFLFSGSVQRCLCFSGNSSKSGSCIERERKALLSIQKGIYDAHKWLSWNGKDCCRWRGVGCDAMTGHVVKLDLHYPYPYDVGYPDNHRPNKSEVSPCLLHLRHLNYLDLSMNYFGGVSIPDFIGSLATLEYLNLSNAGFGGIIPHQLGNLSNLLYLDLTSDNLYSLDVDNLSWLAQIRFLQHLDLSGVDLSKASNWIHVINMLPSLSVLRLSIANLSSLPSILPYVNFTSLTTLDLFGNNFASSIPGWMFNLSSLEYLNLGLNHFHGNIPLTIGNLKKLQVLDLSMNGFGGEIPKTLWSLKNLRSIDLHQNSISGGISETVGNLKSLESLDLSGNRISGEIPKTIGRLTKLRSLGLGENNISGVIPRSIGNLTGLRYFYANANNITGRIPETIGNLKYLVILDLSSNIIKEGLPESIGNLHNLWALYLSNNQISGEIPGTIGNLGELRRLYLSNNVINGQIPEAVGNLHQLEELLLDNNTIAGVIPRTVGNLCNLHNLDASENNIGGEITGFMEGFSRCSPNRLRYADLHDNNVSGPLPSQIGKLQSLESLNLGVNSLNGSIPASLGKLSSLSELNLTSNFLVGALMEAHFANLTSLTILDLSHNSLTTNASQDWLPPFKATEIRMGSCPLGPKFPPWLRNQTDLSILDISSAGISENFPDWFWDMCLSDFFLNASHNHMKGKLPGSLDCFWIDGIDLSYNSFEGHIPQMNPMLTLMDLSNNLFSGPIPPDLAGGVDYLYILLLSHNRINGSIPSAFCEANHLKVLNLADNDLSGVLPDCWNNSLVLSVIDFSDNRLSGGIPSSMGSLSQLNSLHLRNNNLSGGIPKWIGESLSSLKVLRLRSNMLDGNIPMNLSLLASLQVLDLADNNLSGTLPPSFGNFRAMIVIQNESKSVLSEDVASYYTENLLITMKSIEVTFTTVLSLVTSLDLSDNNISGQIPEELTNLHGLHFLNLSGNHLTGRIPKNIGAMGQLESLDLSMNNLSSAIPTSISDLNFLEHLNLSYNNLSGRIPSGNQLQTLINDPSIYIGNRYLCGQPLPEKCLGDEPAGGPTAEKNSEMIWFYVSLSPGFVVGFWGFLGAVMIKKSTRYAYIRFIDRLCDWIYMATTINSSKPKSKRNRGRV
ncbi:uncharacterized protein [Elaeis guineensis]|uniref:Receptor-like protein EIX2 isoform X2 n=1 Tax=Elaeis guineensis var. tenera TaxID=51953 RepID=A0A6I9QE93_ELAGV|nr:receptor-like protein EIX2 isoform X2 [Elaeis guineensis]